jgi:hypothetical protein|tara:strand:+ start:192 stop:320 length:129 start_codon:yes stop_codon:yes gene_type:complete
MFLVGSIIRNQYITSIGLFYKNLEECGGMSDCEELVGVTNRI